MSFNFMAAVTSTEILEPKEIKSVSVSTFSPSICHKDGTEYHDLNFLNVEC